MSGLDIVTTPNFSFLQLAKGEVRNSEFQLSGEFFDVLGIILLTFGNISLTIKPAPVDQASRAFLHFRRVGVPSIRR